MLGRLAWWCAILAATRSELSAQGTSHVELADQPSCASCRLEIGASRSVADGLKNSDFWIGRVSGLAFSSAGELFVADYLRHCVWKIQLPEGNATCMGREGDGPGEFRAPIAPAPLPDKGVAVYDFLARRISLFDGDGQFRRSFNLPFSLRGTIDVASDENSTLFVSGFAQTAAGSMAVHRFSYNGAYLGSFGPTSSNGQPGGGVLHWDRASRRLWWASSDNNYDLRVFDSNGNQLAGFSRRTGNPQAVEPNTSLKNGQLRFSAPNEIPGTVAILGLNDHRIVTVTSVGEGLARFDAFDGQTMQFEKSWTGPLEPRLADSNGKGEVLFLDASAEQQLRRASAIYVHHTNRR